MPYTNIPTNDKLQLFNISGGADVTHIILYSSPGSVLHYDSDVLDRSEFTDIDSLSDHIINNGLSVAEDKIPPNVGDNLSSVIERLRERLNIPVPGPPDDLPNP
jgi:hypothetical protein